MKYSTLKKDLSEMSPVELSKALSNYVNSGSTWEERDAATAQKVAKAELRHTEKQLARSQETR